MKAGNKVIVDTNIWINFLLNRKQSFVENYFLLEGLILVFSNESINELFSVTQRNKFRKYFPFQDVIDFMRLLENYAEIFTVTTSVEICRDPNDNFLLALAIDSKAHYLITNDNDLLVLDRIMGTRIVTLTNYLNENKPPLALT